MNSTADPPRRARVTGAKDGDVQMLLEEITAALAADAGAPGPARGYWCSALAALSVADANVRAALHTTANMSQSSLRAFID